MLHSHSREKLLHAINYFAYNTKYCGKVKLFKLLYFLDFQHYMEVGRSVTSTEYFAWKMGPVPVALQDEFENPSGDMLDAMNVTDPLPGLGRLLKEMPTRPNASNKFDK